MNLSDLCHYMSKVCLLKRQAEIHQALLSLFLLSTTDKLGEQSEFHSWEVVLATSDFVVLVLEASDVDHLYDQFEASAEFGVDGDDFDGDDFDDDDDDDDRQEKTSTILAAVQNHFASSSTDASGNKERKSPRIGKPSQDPNNGQLNKC